MYTAGLLGDCPAKLKDSDAITTKNVSEIVEVTLFSLSDHLKKKHVKDTGNAVKDTGNAVKDTGNAVKDTGHAVKDTGNAVKDTGMLLRIQGILLRIQGMGVVPNNSFRTSEQRELR